MKSEYSLLIDWITITGHWLDWDDMFAFLGLSDDELINQFEQCAGQDFYQFGICLKVENRRAITLLQCNVSNTESCEIRLSGKGCRVFESYSDITIEELLQRIVNTENVNCSRLDIAFDVKDERYSMERFLKNYRKHLFVCSARTSKVIQSVNTSDFSYKGASLYFGSRNSLIEINIYDKAAERGYDKTDLPLGWVRLELRLRREAALSFLNSFTNSDSTVGELYFSVLRHQLRFIAANQKDSNKRRWKNAKWWDELTLNAIPVKLSMPGVVYDIPKYKENVVKRVSSSLQTWFKLNPNATLDDFLVESDRLNIEMNKTQKFIVELYKQGIEYLDMN